MEGFHARIVLLVVGGSQVLGGISDGLPQPVLHACQIRRIFEAGRDLVGDGPGGSGAVVASVDDLQPVGLGAQERGLITQTLDVTRQTQKTCSG